MTSLPPHLIKRAPKSENIRRIRSLLGDSSIHTVCESAKCPNIGECFSKNTVTFLILGDICTRNCAFCGVEKGKPLKVDEKEPEKVAEVAKKLGLKYVVITSVTRDDLPDGGAGHFSNTIKAVKGAVPGAKIEVLIPDFNGDVDSLSKVVEAGPFVINHNMETIECLYISVRPEADYGISLNLLKNAKKLNNDLYTKSGFMVGLGETGEEVASLMDDLACAGCDILTIGQYLRPSKEQMEVKEYVAPGIFEEYRSLAERKGFKKVLSGPFVRSSYMASEWSRPIKVG